MKVVPIAALGVSCVGLWVGLFAVGLLIDSEPYRKPFAPRNTAVVAAGAASAPPPVSAGADDHPRDLMTFGKAVLFFTPLNAALLALLAYLVGYDPTRLQDLLDGLPRLGKKT